MSSTPPQLGQRMFQFRSNSPSRVACSKPAMTRSSSSFAPAGEIERVDAAERWIRRVLDQPLDRVRHIRLSRLSQRRKESFGLAHTLTDRMRQGVREGQSLLWETAPWFGGHRSVRFSAVSGAPTATSATRIAQRKAKPTHSVQPVLGRTIGGPTGLDKPRPAAPLRSRDARRSSFADSPTRLTFSMPQCGLAPPRNPIRCHPCR